jgi:CHAT domain-containing protein/tetratricopeptide (TPR) repeat protein
MSAGRSDDAVPVDLGAWTDAGSRLVNKGIATGDADLVRRAVTRFESVLAATRPGDSNHARAAANTANALVVEFELTGRADALDRAITILDVVEPDSADFGSREADFFSISGHALLRDAERSGLAATADRAVAARRRALELTGRQDAAYPGRMSDLGAVLATRFRIIGDLAALREAVKVHEAGTRGTPPGDASSPGRLSNLGTCLDDLAMRTGDAAMLQRAVDVQRRAVGATRPGDPLAPMIMANLGIALEHLYEETGSRPALGEAISFHRQAVEQTPEEHVEYCPRLSNLAVALLSLHERTGELSVLDEAIDILRLAVDRTPTGHANRFRYLHDLAAALVRLAERTGDMVGADEALGLWQDVVQATPDPHPAKPGRLSALAMANFLRFQRDPSDPAHLDSAIKLLREALALIPDGHAQQAMLLSNLGGLLDSRFEYTGDKASLEEALGIHRRAVELTRPDHSNRGPHVSNLGIALLHKARISESDADVNHAVAVLDEALTAIGPDHPGRALTLYALGVAHARAFELGQAEALDRGLAALRDAADIDGASIVVRIRADRDRGRLAASGSVLGDALDGFGSAVRLMEEAAWAGLGRADQQLLLTELHGLPMDAAAMAIAAGRLEEAVELLEQGRGILLARRLEAPGLHAQLRSHAPELAEQLAWVQNALDEPAAEGADLGGEPGSLTQPLGTAERRTRLARQRAAILDQVRSQPGLEDLARPPTLERLATAAAQGPVVIVNISQYRCDTLIISGDQLSLVPLAAVTAQAVAEQVQNLLDRTDAAERAAVEDVLQWTWDHIVEPVYTNLGLTELSPAGEEPHVWWCATGLTAFLPLHAAGDQRKNGQPRADALDLAVSSYTPTLRTLLQLRERKPGPAGADAGPLIVAMPETPGLNDLAGTEREAAYVADRISPHTLLKGPSATRDAVTQALPRHRWAHFSCHGSQDLRAPDRGALHLHDGPLTIPQIMRLQLPSPALAYLSACDTSRGGTGIPDEAITLAAALQIAGYQHVIGTLWQISGLTATDVVQRVYDQIVTDHDGVTQIDAAGAAAALRIAVRAIRDESPQLPALYWAAFIHTGP